MVVPSRRALATGAGAAIGLVAVLAVAIRTRWVREADTDVSAAAVDFGRDHPGWTVAAWWVTWLGGVVAAVVVLIGLLAWLGAAHRWLAVGYAAVALLAPGPLVEGVKALVDRPRPHAADPLAHLGGSAFPSGHAAHAAATGLALWLLLAPRTCGYRRVLLAVGVVVAVLAVGVSRVALGAHFPTDVLAGWALGAGWAAGTAALLPARAWSSRG